LNSDFARAPALDEKSGILYFIALNARGEDLCWEIPQQREFTVPMDSAHRGVPPATGLEIPADEIRRGGYWDNLGTLLPNTRSLGGGVYFSTMGSGYLVGTGIASTSALGDFQYYLFGQYNSRLDRSAIEASLQTNVLAPLIADFDLSYLGEPCIDGFPRAVSQSPTAAVPEPD